MSLRMAWTRFSPDGVSRYSAIFLPPKFIGGRSPRRTTSPIEASNREPTETSSASHSRISEATETFVRSRSSLDTNPLVSPLCSATSAMVLRAASLAAFSCAPILVPSGTAGGVPFPLLVLGICPPSPVLARGLEPVSHYDTPGSRYETMVDIQETCGDYSLRGRPH